MNKLLCICLLFWVIPALLKDISPAIFASRYIQWTSIAGLAILLPIGFTKSIANCFALKANKLRSLSYTFSFLFMFCFLLIMQFPAHYASSTLLGLEPIPIARGTNLLERVVTAETEENRKKAAEIIFREYGKKVTYKLATEKFKLFEPTIDDIEKYEKSNRVRVETVRLKKQVSKNSLQILFIQLFEIICFFVFFGATFILEQKKSKHN